MWLKARRGIEGGREGKRVAGGRKKDTLGKGLQVEEKDVKREIEKPAETKTRSKCKLFWSHGKGGKREGGREDKVWKGERKPR